MDMKMTHETISAFTDGEVRPGAIEEVMAQLRGADGRGAWDLYQKIGDVLRSDDMVAGFRPGFEARLFARLDAEPTILMPAGIAVSVSNAEQAHKAGYQAEQQTQSGYTLGDGAMAHTTRLAAPARRFSLRRLAVPGAAAAAVAALAFVSAPQLMVALTKSPTTFASMNVPAAQLASAEIKLASAPGLTGSSAAQAHHGDVLRDPGLDEYLMAHQRFSPSVYSTAQFARASTFVDETGK